jgi:hypothetical protein
MSGYTAWYTEGGGKLVRFPSNPVRYVHKIVEQKYAHIITCRMAHFRLQTKFINFRILTCVIMHYNKRCIFCCTFFKYSGT